MKLSPTCSFGLILLGSLGASSLQQLQPPSVRRNIPSSIITHNLLFRYRGGSSSSSSSEVTQSTALKSSSSSVIINGGAVVPAVASNQTTVTTSSPDTTAAAAASVVPVPPSQPPQTVVAATAVAAQKQQLLQRSGIVTASCVLTWTLVQLLEISSIQASGVTGLAACFLFRNDPASTAAAFCGSFAGMSGHVVASSGLSVLHAALLGLCNAVTYYWWTDQKLQIGKGGRLGTIAFLGNVLYFALQKGALATLAADVLAILKPSTAVALLVSSVAMLWQRRQQRSQTTLLEQQQVSTTTTTEITSPLRYIATNLPKLVILGSLLARFLATSATQNLVPTVLTTFVTSLLVKKSPGVVFPVALAGLLGGTLLPASYAAAVYMGAFLGMTGLSNFGLQNFWDASLLSTLLLQLGVLNGFGGKLGFLAFVGVNFAM